MLNAHDLWTAYDLARAETDAALAAWREAVGAK